MMDALYSGAKEGYNGYAPSEGYLELREEIVKREKKRMCCLMCLFLMN